MSYRNPQQNVDTQSAQGIANLQRTIAGTFGGIVQQELQTQKELGIEQKKLADKRAKELKQYEKLEEQVALGIKKYEIDNPDLKLGDSMAPLVDSYSDIMTRINSGAVTDPKEIAALRSQAADILTMPKRIGNMLESISATDLLMTETEGKSGRMGGLDPSQEGNMPEAMRVLMNKAKGDRSTRIEFENGKYKAYIDVTPEGGEKITLTEEQLADYLSGKTQGVQIIPDATKAMENLKNTHIQRIDSEGKKTYIKSAFGEERTREIEDGKGNVIRIETYKPLKRDYLASAGKAVIESEISAMSKTEKVAFMNNIIAPDTKGFTVDNIEDKESKEALLKGYTDYWLNNFASDQVISTRNVALPKESKPSALDKKEAKVYKDIEKDLSVLTSEAIGDINRANITSLAQKIGVAVNQDDVETASGKKSYNLPIKGGKGFLTITPDASDKDVLKLILKAKGYKSSDVDTFIEAFYEKEKESMQGTGPLSSDFTNPEYFTKSSANSAARFN